MILFSYLADYKMSGLENMQLLSLEEVHKDKFENDTHDVLTFAAVMKLTKIKQSRL